MKYLDENAIAERFAFADGFHHPDWEFIRQSIEKICSPEVHEEAWNEALAIWLKTLRDDLGGDYILYQSASTVLLSDQPKQTAQWLLDYSDKTACSIKQHFGEIAWQGASGKDVVLVFSDEDDYYHYLAYYSLHGEQASSGGVSIQSGYTHIAMPWHDPFNAANTIVHELSHDCVAHLTLPRWLDEGVAQTLQRALAPLAESLGQNQQDALYAASTGWRPPLMWDELAERHFSFWHEQNIQSFWAGTSFYEPGDSNELSYSLAEVLINLLSERCTPPIFRAFLEGATPDDAGQTAALNILHADLGELAGTFLGDGNWRPNRKAMIACRDAAGWND